ncbi:uncharacterized protein EDB91DRAFT_1242542 [Suillus paluster]|uniref:uncharacterized protein n=1 Tax=Suillus paluster TaxID=48578 RepID=UPI001B8685DE|nr:uncharacterized protein EDB91DRAFT_1242542 [Suillus paluster]KAG1753562.1 hypothetical protein EDB91DRAFT_1242542 [Suillus paluster]
MSDFNPSAVARGIGKVVREPKTFPASVYGFTQDVATYLPYVEMRSYRDFDDSLEDIILDEESVLLFTRATTEENGRMLDVEIIDM